MLRHVVMFKLSDSAPAGAREAIMAGFAELAKLPMVYSYVFGNDLALGTGNYDIVLVADFRNVDDWRAYMSEPSHVEFVTNLIRPNIAARSAVQYDIGP